MKREMNPNSLANLEKGKFKKGQVTNPNGRPRNELSITAKQREMLALPCPYAPGKTWLEWLADRGMALAGENASYYKELMDRLEGKVLQPVGGEDGGPIKYDIRVTDTETKQLTDRIIKGNQVVANIGLS